MRLCLAFNRLRSFTSRKEMQGKLPAILNVNGHVGPFSIWIATC